MYTRVGLSIAETNPLFIYCARLSLSRAGLHVRARSRIQRCNEETLMTVIIFDLLSDSEHKRRAYVRAYK